MTTVLLLAGALLVPSAAQAHDELVSSAPADGAELEAMPGELVLTFSNVPIGLGSEVRIQDSAGTDWADGDVVITDRRATQRIKPGAPAGGYTVLWRVASSDSHPIEGSFGFTVTAGGQGTPAASAQPTAGLPEPIETATGAPAAAAPDEPAVPWSVIGMAAVLVVLAVIIAVTARRRLGGGRQQG
ncbi:copper resistance protein CopC [Arthrobacter sp. E918]|uniref:Copper resistance protein CopC n=1 Tax=Arthrobacter mobilis TaxID=2724944 RepID=A0A7X6K6H9_9MICC|nr:copper resistance protein CopC [Arthrobacter mobilis]